MKTKLDGYQLTEMNFFELTTILENEFTKAFTELRLIDSKKIPNARFREIEHLNYMSVVYYGFTHSALNARYQIASPNSVVNAVYYQSLIYMTDIAKVCGFDEDSIYYEQRLKT